MQGTFSLNNAMQYNAMQNYAIKYLQLTNSMVCFAQRISKKSSANIQTMRQCNIKCSQQYQYKMMCFALASVNTQTMQGVVLTTKQCDPCENVCLAMLTTSNCNFGVVSQTFANFTNSTMESLRCAPKSDTIWTFPGEIRHTGEGGISC